MTLAEATPPQVTLEHSEATDLPVGVIDRRKPKWWKRALVILVALVAGLGWAMIAASRGEHVNAVWVVLAACGSFIIGYTFYARLIEYKMVRPRDDRATPAEYAADGQDYMRTDRRVLFGHHFAAIAGAGPLVGPVMAAQMGYLPGTLWIVLGVIFAGAVQDYLVLWASTRRRGRSLGEMLRNELGSFGGIAGMIAVISIMVIIVAVLALVVVNALAGSPWGVFSIAMTIPISLFMGCYLRFLRPGRVSEATVIGVVLLLAAIIGGGYVSETSWGVAAFTWSKPTLAVALILYGIFASSIPVWLLLAPRDYLATFMKVGVIGLLAVGILIDRPTIQMPALTQFGAHGGGPVFSGELFPFLFITIACGALSGFHALISSGTTPKMIEKERQLRMIGYGSMLMESFVAIMALITAVVLDQHIYFAMNSPTSVTHGTVEGAAAFVNSLGLTSHAVNPQHLADMAQAVGEPSIISRTGGAPTLAVGMSQILTNVFGHPGMQSFWYHFGVMFEALFILTTVDAGTRTLRFMMTDPISRIPGLKKVKDPSFTIGNIGMTILVCAMWGSILVMGVTDPLGGINVLFPLFGIANQLLAAVALALVTVIVVKKGYYKWAWIPAVPLVFDTVITMTASFQKIFHSDPTISYWSQHARFKEAQAQGLQQFGSAKSPEEINAVVFNTAVQGVLSILFAVLVLCVLVGAVVAIVRAIRRRTAGLEVTTSEEPAIPSKTFAPTGIFPTDVEKRIQAEWDKANA